MNDAAERDREASDDSGWSTVETVVRGDIVAEVRCKNNYTVGHPPLYSVRVGRARLAGNAGSASVWISPHISIYDLPVAEKLMHELGEKYRNLRDEQTRQTRVETKRSAPTTTTPRMGMSRDGALEVVPARSATQPAPRQSTRSAYYGAYRDDIRDED